ncbi:hypothetical protein QBC32DRAFT_89506 [Pseudoneurospora amorphoporcata]|uniref:Uncharacterized protein n=1 Tax=Pseudoneurospora amorphoporcata TaxID=241081 RepID=A0AAN6NK80_9PEZI|nr:hypothetical protein QBC32DRAFT_89506 [Pseudoneurospora amorphoporcata]
MKESPSANPVVAFRPAALAQAAVSHPLPASFQTLHLHQPLARRRAFPFFQLPPEIRNMVYGFMVTSENPIVPHRTHPIPVWHWHVRNGRGAVGPLYRLYDALPTVFRISPRFAREAEVVFYTTNTFDLDLTYHRQWLARISMLNSSIIRQLEIKCFQDFGDVDHEDVEAWIAKLVSMGNTVKKRCQGLTELELRFGLLRTETGGEIDARQCLRLFVVNEAVKVAWRLRRLKRLRKLTVRVHEEWQNTEHLVGLLQQLTGDLKRGVVVEGIHVATVNSYRLPGAPPNINQHHHEDQERKFFEGWRDRETGAVVAQELTWEIPVGWPTCYRRNRE